MTDQEKSFIESCFEGNLRFIKTCVKHGVDIHVANDWCIDIAARKGYSKIVTYFLENGISHESAAKKMVLAYTCDAQDLELVKYLIGKSAEYKNETSALQWTAAKGNLPIMELLLGYFNEFNGIFCSAASTGQVTLLQFLIDNDLHNLDSGAERAVYWAGEKGKWNAVELLLENNIGTLDNLGADYSAKLIDWREKTKKNKL
ncbi:MULTISPECIES: ankyrin repeat domain-containing protein [Flavobacteriaceae]|uniref:ankyrin repeat domain-containing protein n=1 Tax=Flavobacteriaceae TaxID=49546 RepID=UPI0004895022|nr:MULTISPECIES: ankyrin repeat domain-containing protein [Flavobacteriaceae]